MKPATTPLALVLAFAIVFLAVGIPYRQLPYSKVSLPSSLYGPGLVVVFVTAVVLRLATGARFIQALTAVGLAVPAVVIARVGVETSRDPTSHNLWPFEVVIAAGVGFAVALAGAALGSLLGALLKKTRG